MKQGFMLTVTRVVYGRVLTEVHTLEGTSPDTVIKQWKAKHPFTCVKGWHYVSTVSR